MGFYNFRIVCGIILIETANSVIQAFRYRVVKEFAGHAFYNGFGRSAFSQSDDWFAVRHGLNGSKAEILLLRHYKGPAGSVIRRNRDIIQSAEECYVLARHMLKFFALRPIADNN